MTSDPSATSIIQAAEQGAWQPIETAPKDGTHILACDLIHKITRVVRWDGETFRANVHSFVELDPDFWMPLPEPPR